MQKIEEGPDGFFCIEDSAVLQYKRHPNFRLICDRVLDVISKRNYEIDTDWEDSCHTAKYRHDYWGI